MKITSNKTLIEYAREHASNKSSRLEVITFLNDAKFSKQVFLSCKLVKKNEKDYTEVCKCELKTSQL